MLIELNHKNMQNDAIHRDASYFKGLQLIIIIINKLIFY